MVHRVGSKGEVTIPKSIREKTGLVPGVVIAFEAVDGGVTVRRSETRSGLKGRFDGSGMAARLIEDRH